MMLKTLWRRIGQRRQGRIGQGFGTIGTVWRQISRRQLAVTVGSAAIMLVALTVFWNFFILPGHLQGSYGNNSKETLTTETREAVQEASSGEKVAPVEKQQNPEGNYSAPGALGDNSVRTDTREVASPQGGTRDPLSSLPANPDLSLAKTSVEGELIKEFGFVFSPTLKDYRFHGAVDVAAAEGTAVKCVLAGVVDSIQSSTEEGVTITVNHGGGVKSVYSHLAQASVDKDIYIEAGQVLGSLGQPGNLETVEGCHLHFGLIRDGEPIDPLQYISF